MFSSEPQRTQFDLNFQLFGIPVRVHPLFWLAGVILGASGGISTNEAIVHIFIWVGVLFFSILVHEFGHALAMRYFGSNARVVLYMMGGLAIPERSIFGNEFTDRTRKPWNSIIISFAGPAAGFLLAGLVVAAALAARLEVSIFLLFGFIPFFSIEGITNPYLGHTVSALLYINIFWGLVNLLPVHPLDGGQISREFFVMKDPWGGLVKSLWLSLIVGAMAAIGGLAIGEPFMAILFGSLAFSSWQMLQSFSGRGGGGGYGSGGRPW